MCASRGGRWPLSFITVIELFRGLGLSEIPRLTDSLKALTLASQLSRRTVLLYPIPFMERELFHLRKAGHERSRQNLKRRLGQAISPNFESELLAGKADVSHLVKIEGLFVEGEKGYINFLEKFLDDIHPQWRAERDRSGSSLPERERERVKREAPVELWKRDAGRRLLECTGVKPTVAAIDIVNDRCDAYLTFTVSVLRDVIMTNYRFEKNWNDFNDEMQLLYLSCPSYCLVTEDTRLIHRVKKSSQSSRIQTVDQFLCG